jgi:anti-sigma factor RsiW
MTGHLSITTLNAWADGELPTEQLAQLTEHLAECPACNSSALVQTILKSGVANAGRRFSPPPHFQEQLLRQARREISPSSFASVPTSGARRPLVALGWATAFALLLVSIGIALLQRTAHRTSAVSTQYAALVTEISDQHIATLAANSPPQVLSSDRHAVKPWFQGKIPFSFNLPQNLPADINLDGANLTYLRNQPVAQLLYSIGRHRVSIFIKQKGGALLPSSLSAERSGFHVAGFVTNDLEVIAVSDVDPARMSELLNRIQNAQTAGENPTQ